MQRIRKRILLVAYACSPYIGSECTVGWHRAIETAKYFDTWVICDKRFENDIKRHLRNYGDIPGLKFCFVPRTRFEIWIWKIPPKLYRLGYNLWHRRVYRIAVRLHEELSFDIIHQVNWTGFREPGYLWKLDVPFIWGPVGGSQNYPWHFLKQAGVVGAVTEATRSAINFLQLRFRLRVRKAVKKAKVLLTSNSTGQRDFRQIYKISPVILLDTGVTAIFNKASGGNDLNKPLRILWSGELKHHKALHLLLFALNKNPDGLKYELRILGQGPLKKRLRNLSRRLEVEQYTSWMGWLKFEDAMKQYEWADILVFSSLRDTSGNVVLEALSRGVPVVCFDHQGVGDMITENCGIKIPVTIPHEVILGLRNAIVVLAKDRTKLKTLSHGAVERARKYLWSLNGQIMNQIYQKTLNG